MIHNKALIHWDLDYFKNISIVKINVSNTFSEILNLLSQISDQRLSMTKQGIIEYKLHGRFVKPLTKHRGTIEFNSNPDTDERFECVNVVTHWWGCHVVDKFRNQFFSMFHQREYKKYYNLSIKVLECPNPFINTSITIEIKNYKDSHLLYNSLAIIRKQMFYNFLNVCDIYLG